MTQKIRLICTKGKLKGMHIDLESPHVYSIGRASDCNLHIPRVPDCQAVSRHHCLLSVDLPRVEVFDCGSRNGTFVNDTRIGQPIPGSKGVRCTLKRGDRLRVGNLAFRVDIIDDDLFESPEVPTTSEQMQRCDLSRCEVSLSI